MIQQNGKTLLEVRGLCASVNGIDILKGIDLTVRSGEVHALMGPNGSGKSTFAKALAGHPSYVVTGGTVFYEGKNLLELKPEERPKIDKGSFRIFDARTIKRALPFVVTKLLLFQFGLAVRRRS